MRSAFWRGALIGALFVLLVLGIEAFVYFGGVASDARLLFLERIASLPRAVVSQVTRDLLWGVGAIYLAVAVYAGLCVGVAHWVLKRAGRRWLWLWSIALLAWVYLSGQLRLMAVHPYARNDWLWQVLEPRLRSFWTPALATWVVVLGALVMCVIVGWRHTRAGLQFACALVLFVPLLGPQSAGLVASDSAPSAHTGGSSSGPTPIIILGVDALRTDHVTAELTPHVDAFMRGAFTFREARTPIARTHPSWISMLTALTPDHNGVRYNRAHPSFATSLPVTLPSHLKANGFHTRYLTDDNMFSRLSAVHGIDVVDEPPSTITTYATKPAMKLWLMTLLPARWLSHAVPALRANRFLYHSYDARDYVERVTSAIDEEVARGGPFFLASHTCIAHFPGTQPGPHYRDHQHTEAPAVGYFRVSLASLARYDPHVTDEQSARLRGLYAAGVREADAAIGAVLQHLKDIGLYERALIVLWSDHGESLHDREGQPIAPNHGVYIDNHDEDLRIVMAIKAPGAAMTGSSDALVRSLDLAPTLLDALALPPLPGPRDGTSLLAHMRGAAAPELPHYAETELKWGRLTRPGEQPYRFEVSQAYAYEPVLDDLALRPELHDEIVHGKHRALREGRFQVLYHPVGDGEWHLVDATGSEPGYLEDKYPGELARLKTALVARMDADVAPPSAQAAAKAPPWWPWAVEPFELDEWR